MKIPPRKALGQHFLADRTLLARIAAATSAGPQDIVLEIGPGPGGLTEALLDTGATVVAIERDARLRDVLARRFADRAFTLVLGDALALDWPSLVAPWTAMGQRWIVAGNIPYNITSPLLDRALSAPLPASVTFLVQREVADRVVAQPGTRAYGGLSIGMQVVAEPERLFTIAKGAFAPPPKVESAVLRLIPRAAPLVAPHQIASLRWLVTSIFSYRRKTMQRALRQAFDLTAEEAGRTLAAADIEADVRPEVVTPAQFIRLLDALESRVDAA